MLFPSFPMPGQIELETFCRYEPITRHESTATLLPESTKAAISSCSEPSLFLPLIIEIEFAIRVSFALATNPPLCFAKMFPTTIQPSISVPSDDSRTKPDAFSALEISVYRAQLLIVVALASPISATLPP